MQTYSRKRPEYQEIEGVKDLCRLCLEKCDEVVPIFTDNTDVCSSLPMRIMICVGLEMAREECLPNIICKECYMELERYYTFRKKCVISYQKLKSHILATKLRDARKYKSDQIEKNQVQENSHNEQILENGDKDEQQLILTYNEGEPLEIVDVVNLNGVIQIGEGTKKVADLTNTTHVTQELEESQMPELPTSTSLPTVQTTSESDMSNLLTSLLLELGVVSQQNDRLKVMQNVRTLELEGEDGSMVLLELVEEDFVQVVTDKESTVDFQDTHEDIETATVAEVPTEPEKTQTTVVTLCPVKSEGVKNKKTKDLGAAVWCKICDKRFSTRSVLARHALVHTAERPHKCARCGRGFAQRAVLRRHELVHQERRPFSCTVCGKSYTQRGALASHARVHRRALTLHRCTHCPKVFLYPSGLSRHMKMHEGRVYTCGGCSRQFRDKSALMRHVRNANHRLV